MIANNVGILMYQTSIFSNYVLLKL